MRFFTSLKEAFLRLLIPGSVFLGVSAVVSLAGFMMNEPKVNQTAMNIMPYTVLPVLIIIAFSFLMKRSSADVFHALPVKRQTVFISNLLVCVLWTALCYLVAIGISSLCFKGYNIDLFTHLCTFVFVLGASSLGTVLTGRIFSSVVNTLIIALVPKLLYNTVLGSIFSRLPFVIFDAPGMAKYSYTSFLPVKEERLLYLIAGAVLTVLAFILFLLRKSETAGKSAPNRFLRIFHSGIIAFSVSLIAIYLVSKGESMGTVILVYGISVIVPFLYEFLSTRRLDGLKYGFIAIIIMAVLNVGVYAFMETTVARVQNERIEIKGYQVINRQVRNVALRGRGYDNLYTWADWENDYDQYGYLTTLDFFADDEEACERLKERYEISKQVFIDDGGEYYTDVDGVTYIKTAVVLLDEKGERHYRYAYLSHDEKAYYITKVLSEDEEFLEKVAALPKIEKVDKVTCVGDAEKDRMIYQRYCEEAQENSVKERVGNTYTVYNQCNEYITKGFNPDSYFCIKVEGTENGRDFFGYYYVDNYDHPETHQMIEDFKQPYEVEEAKEIINEIENGFYEFQVKLECKPDEGMYPERENIRWEDLEISEEAGIYRVRVNNMNIKWEDVDPSYNIKKEDVSEVYYEFYRHPDSEVEEILKRLGELAEAHQTVNKEHTGNFLLSYKKESGDSEKTIRVRLDITYDEYKAFVESVGGRVNYD